MNSEVHNLRRLASAAISDEAARLARVGKTSTSWCYCCGRATGDLARCGCQFSQSLHCAGEKLCGECHGAHRAVARFLSGMFAHPPVRRVDALRARKFRFLRNALKAISETFHDPRAAGLKRELSILDSYLDPRDEFQSGVLDIFSRSKFSRWPEFAQGLRDAEHAFYLESVIASGILNTIR